MRRPSKKSITKLPHIVNAEKKSVLEKTLLTRAARAPVRPTAKKIPSLPSPKTRFLGLSKQNEFRPSAEAISLIYKGNMHKYLKLKPFVNQIIKDIRSKIVNNTYALELFGKKNNELNKEEQNLLVSHIANLIYEKKYSTSYELSSLVKEKNLKKKVNETLADMLDSFKIREELVNLLNNELKHSSITISLPHIFKNREFRKDALSKITGYDDLIYSLYDFYNKYTKGNGDASININLLAHDFYAQEVLVAQESKSIYEHLIDYPELEKKLIETAFDLSHINRLPGKTREESQRELKEIFLGKKEQLITARSEKQHKKY